MEEKGPSGGDVDKKEESEVWDLGVEMKGPRVGAVGGKEESK